VLFIFDYFLLKFEGAKVGRKLGRDFIVNVHYKKIFLLSADFLLFIVHLFENCKRTFHIAVCRCFSDRQIVVECGQVLICGVSKYFKDFLFRNGGALFVGEKREFAKAVYYSDEIDFEAFLFRYLQVGFGWGWGRRFGLLEEFYFSFDDAASVLRIVLFV